MQRTNVAGAVVVGAAINANKRNNGYLFALQRRWPEKIFAFPDHDSYWSPPSDVSPAHSLESLLDAHPFRGISLYLADDEDGSRLLDRKRTAAFGLASARRLVLSLGMRPQHVPAVIRLAEKHPRLRVLCHHFAGVTSRRPTALHNQLAAVLPLHEVPSIYLKLSGFPYLSPEPWGFPFTEQADVVQGIYEAFGAARLCWGSNFPVIDGAITYRQSLELVLSQLPTASDTDRSAMLGGTMRGLLSA
jgi:predicted TIM-barrel fold metal-dependent hydrolase